LGDLGAQQCQDLGVRQDSPRNLGRAEAGHTPATTPPVGMPWSPASGVSALSMALSAERSAETRVGSRSLRAASN
ncbi:MAG TPA: hypothetical protein VI029_09930, partial [Mycobacterium sp.]